jgi:MOSC domain-containing protein YiiM
MAEAGTLLNVWIKPARGEPMAAVETAKVFANSGLVGNSDQGGSRQITVLSAERWADVEADLGRTVEPSARRANLLVDGVELADTTGRTLRVGDARIEIRGETRPCFQMDAELDGLQDALDADWRGGAYGVVLGDATINVGDAVSWE